MNERIKNFLYLVTIVTAFTFFLSMISMCLGRSIDWAVLAVNVAVLIGIGYIFFVSHRIRDVFKKTRFLDKYRARRMPSTRKEKIYFLIGAIISPTAGLGATFLASGFLEGIGIPWLAAILGLLIFFGIFGTGLALTNRALGLSKQKKKGRDNDSKKDLKQDSWF
jgi:hypothetical protein